MAGFVYILTNRKHGALYIGVTNNIVRRVHEHKTNAAEGFTARYQAHKPIYFEEHETVPLAIAREKQLKKWKRDWKLRLIKEFNPEWIDLFDGIAS